MILLHLFHHDWDMWDILLILIVLAIIFRKKLAIWLFNALFYIIMMPLLFPIALISAIFNWEPKFVKRWEKEIEEYKKKNQ